MAVVGNAYVVVHAITAGFETEVKNALSRLKPQMNSLGNDLGKSISGGATPAVGGLAREALGARKALNSMIRSGYLVGPAIAGAVSAVSDLIFGLGAMVAAVGSAAPALAVLANGMSALAQAGLTAKLAFSGIGKAVQALNKQQSVAAKNDNIIKDARIALTEAYQRAGNAMADANDKVRKAQLALNKAYQAGAESLQQLGFNAEDASIAQSKAAIELERARETLMRSQDLSPDSRARREAELAFKEAELNYRKSTDQVNDLRKEQEYAAKTGIEGTKEVLDAKNDLLEAEKDRNRQEVENAQSIAKAQNALARAIASAKQGVGSLADAFKGMSPEAIKFAKYLVSIRPEIDKLKAAAGEKMFGPLTEAIQLVIDKLFPVLIPILKATGGVIGTFAKNFAKMITKPENLAIFERVFGESNLILLENFGEVVINLAEAALHLLDAVRPLAEDFSEWLVGVSEDAKNADLSDTFTGAAKAAETIGTALKGLFDGFKAFMKVAAPVGLTLIESLGKAGESMADFFNPKTKKGQDEMGAKFTQIGENVKAMGGFFGEVLKMLFEMAGNKGVEDFFKAIKPIPGILADVGKELTGSGATLGEFFVQLAEVFALFVETGGLEMFFNVLTEVLKVVEAIFSNPIIAQVFLWAAAFKGFTLGVGTVLKVLKFFGLGLIVGPGNSIIKLGNFIENFGAKMGKMRAWFGQVGSALKTIFSTIFKGISFIFQGIMRVASFIMKLLGPVFRFLGSVFMRLISVAGKFFGVVVQGLRIIAAAAMANPLVAIIVLIIAALVLAYMKSEKFREIVNNAFQKIKDVVSGVVTWLKEAVPKAFEFIKDAFLKYTLLGIIIKNWDKIIEFFKGLPGKIKNAAAGLWDGLKDSFKNAINWLITKWNDFKLEIKIPSNFVTDKLGWSGKGVTLDTPNIPLLAQGGVVYPRSGGVNAILAEAGRPERVEPLDPNGLSARDKAMIEMMSGRGGATSSPTLHIYPSQGMDELALAHNVSRNLAWSMRRGV